MITVTASPHLVIVRGNSASGKTTLAEMLQHALGRGTANVGQDHFRRVVLREHDVPDGDNVALIRNTVQFCLGINYNVILEGILTSRRYGQMLRDLVADHDGPSHLFYLNVPLEETLRRHDGRPLGATLNPEKLRQWFVASDVLGLPNELILGGEDLHDTFRLMQKAIGPVTPRRVDDRANFL